MTADIERYISEHIDAIGREMFPDDPDTRWTVKGFRHVPDMTLAEVEPDDEGVGYPRFVFGFIERKGTPEHVATWCFEDAAFVLLSTSRRAPKGLPKRLP